MLEKIESPADLRKLSLPELKDLAAEMREVIVKQVAEKGGHLSSNLGTIELTLALHKVYQTPVDKLVWDTGHQAYPHKLVTGRYKQFHTLKQYGGLSGFLRRDESEYDVFGAGHATTSLTAALGVAAARTHLKKDFEVAAIIGDGSLTGGMAYEALNNAGETEERITFILNDNKMSIAPNVGAISKYLNRIISNPTYNRIKDDVWDFTGKLPHGKQIQHLVSRVDETVKSFILPGGFFEDLNIRYFGPIDGHSLEDLIQILEKTRAMPGPKLVHVVTTKGYGWDRSEADCIKWHASVPFDLDSGKPKSAPAKTPGLTQVFGEALLEIAKADERVIAITAAMPEGCGVHIMRKELPARVYDVGIAEPYAVTFAAGLATEGMKPVVAVYSSFMQRAFDQIVHDVAMQDLNVVFVLDRAGLVGLDGPTHHGVLDLGFLRMVPGMVIMAPSDEVELRHMLHTAIRYDKGPIALRYPRGNAFAPDAKPAFETLPIGVPRVDRPAQPAGLPGAKGGAGPADLLLLAVGNMLHPARKAHDRLVEEGWSCTLVDARFVKPLDAAAYGKLLAGHQAVLTVEDNAITGGYGSGVAEFMAEAGIGLPVKHVGLPDSFVTHGEIPVLQRLVGLDADGIHRAASDLLQSVFPERVRTGMAKARNGAVPAEAGLA